MGSIQKQYQEDTEDSYSLESRAHSVCERPHLDKRDIMDLGLAMGSNGRTSSAGRFVVKEPLLLKLTNVLTQLQELCTASAQALGDKKAGYVLDPDNMMLPILSAASTVGDLERAWRLLIQRISRAQEKLDRNFKKFRHEEIPPSPATTDPQIYEAIKGNWEPEEVMARLYMQVPSMSKLLTHEECSKLEQGRSVRSALGSPIELKAAFPDRKPEPHPSGVYYNDDGARIHATDPDSLIPRRAPTLPSRA